MRPIDKVFNKIIENYDYFIFDLDDTIYAEKDYLFQQYARIAAYIESKYAYPSPIIKSWLEHRFLTKGRDRLFDELITHYSLSQSDFSQFLLILRTEKLPEKLKVFPKIKTFFELLIERKKKIFVITNGNVDQQKNKISHLDWEGMLEKINFIYANETRVKPHSDSFYQSGIQDNEKTRSIMIGDSDSDQLFASNVGINFLFVHNL